MKLTAKQVSDLYIDAMNSHPGMVKSEIVWTEFTEHLNGIIELETCHELALSQNVAVGSIGTHVNGSYQNIYESLYMKPAPPPLTRVDLLSQMLENEYNGREVYQGIEIIDYEGQWSSIAEHCDIDLQHPENYRIIK